MLQSDKVQSSDQGKNRLRNAYKEAGLTIEKLADEAQVSPDTIKRLLGTKDCPNGVERWAVINIAKVLNIKPTDIVDSKDWNPQQIPPEFERLIKDKTESFRGRKFVFDAIEEFFSNNPNGYFTVVGDAGMGKSAIAAKYVLDNPEAICFFNVRAEGMNRPELFLKKIRQQLMSRYQLQDTADADLSTLLTKASEKITAGDRLVIVVDALDEVDQESTGNLLYLPTILPERVYFLLTRRPSNQNEKRLNVSPSVPTQELDLRDYADRSSQDVKEYIWLLLNESENNFMYLHHTLNAIAEGFDSQWQFDCILPGLEAYYQQHWQKMKGEALSDLLLKVVGVLTCAETGEISAKGIAQAISQRLDATRTAEDEYDVEEILENWLEFLHQHRIGKETRYSFYHSHFRLWLANQTGIC